MSLFSQDGKITGEAEKSFGWDVIIGSMICVTMTVMSVLNIAYLPVMIGVFIFMLARMVFSGIVILPFARAKLVSNSTVLSSAFGALGKTSEATASPDPVTGINETFYSRSVRGLDDVANDDESDI